VVAVVDVSRETSGQPSALGRLDWAVDVAGLAPSLGQPSPELVGEM
jgi:hypothetical protein